MLVGADDNCVTAREFPALLSVSAEFDRDAQALTLARDGSAALVVPVPCAPCEPVTVHHKPATGVDAGGEAHEWFSDVIGEPVRLMYQRRPQDRPTNLRYSTPEDRASFADAYPLLLCTSASLDGLNDLVTRGRFPDEGPLSMRRFRPNVVVEGDSLPPWSEDGWRRIRLGDTTFRVAKGSARCIVITSDPDTGNRGREPLATLVKHRRFDGQSWFGINVIPDGVHENGDAALNVGDAVEILESVDHRTGPPR